MNGTTVTRDEGGFVDYVQLLFDKHEIIYAEGIAAESLFVDTTSRPAEPDAVARRVTGAALRLPGRERGAGTLSAPADAADTLRRLSTL